MHYFAWNGGKFCTGAEDDKAIRRAIQNGEESLRVLSKRYGTNLKTVAKWKKRTSLADLPTGPTDPHSTILSLEEEAVIAALRRHTLLPLDDCHLRSSADHLASDAFVVAHEDPFAMRATGHSGDLRSRLERTFQRFGLLS